MPCTGWSLARGERADATGEISGPACTASAVPGPAPRLRGGPDCRAPARLGGERAGRDALLEEPERGPGARAGDSRARRSGAGPPAGALLAAAGRMVWRMAWRGRGLASHPARRSPR